MEDENQLTTTTAPPPAELLMAPDPAAKFQRRRAEFWQICWLITLSSLIISLYAIFLSQRLAPAASQHDLDQAAVLLAEELATLSVKHSRFGSVGIVENTERKHSQVNLNKLVATIRLDGIVARQLGFDDMNPLVQKDADDACKLARELARLERELANPKAAAHTFGRDSLYELAHKVLARAGAGGRLKSLRISLGGLKNSQIGSSTPLPAVPGVLSSFYANGNTYRAHVKVPIWDDLNYEFYEYADSVKLVPVKQFKAVSDDSIASVVMLEAEFEVAERGRFRRIQKMHSAAVLGSPTTRAPGAVFMLSFPQGYLDRLSCINDLFSKENFTDTKGEWFQAKGGDLPGQGHLEQPDKVDMPPSMAAINTLYQFMLAAGPELVPSNLKLLLTEPISSLQINGNDNASAGDQQAVNNCNSGLFKDTGAGSFALKRQSQKNGQGQELLKHAFRNERFSNTMPSSTFPLVVDSSGTLNLPQESGFSKERVQQFLDALYQTNIAGIESMQIADTVSKRMLNLLEQSDKSIASMEEELRSVKRSLETLSVNSVSDPQLEKKQKQLQTQIDYLTDSIKLEQSKKVQYNLTKEKAGVVAQNARQAARSTYEIGSHMSSFVAQGMTRITAPFQGFLLSRTVAFIPHKNPVDEDDLYSPTAAESSNANTEAWTSQKFQVTAVPEPGLYVEDKPIVDYWQTTPQQRSNRPLYVFMSSGELMSAKTPSLFASRMTPFANTGLGNAELCYFAPHSIETGSQQAVSWSVLIRDLVYSMADGQGSPIRSSAPMWCHELGMDEDPCPGLAVEIQIRTPIPKIDKSLSGSYLQDPDGGAPIALFPPLPADLL